MHLQSDRNFPKSGFVTLLWDAEQVDKNKQASAPLSIPDSGQICNTHCGLGVLLYPNHQSMKLNMSIKSIEPIKKSNTKI